MTDIQYGCLYGKGLVVSPLVLVGCQGKKSHHRPPASLDLPRPDTRRRDMAPRPALMILALLGMASPSLSLRAQEKPLRQVIDAEVRAAWKREKVTPVGRADDALFLRRVHLDLVGTIP